MAAGIGTHAERNLSPCVSGPSGPSAPPHGCSKSKGKRRACEFAQSRGEFDGRIDSVLHPTAEGSRKGYEPPCIWPEMRSHRIRQKTSRSQTSAVLEAVNELGSCAFVHERRTNHDTCDHACWRGDELAPARWAQIDGGSPAYEACHHSTVSIECDRSRSEACVGCVNGDGMRRLSTCALSRAVLP